MFFFTFLVDYFSSLQPPHAHRLQWKYERAPHITEHDYADVSTHDDSSIGRMTRQTMDMDTTRVHDYENSFITIRQKEW